MRWLWFLCTLVMAVAAQGEAKRGHHVHEEADHYQGHSMLDFTSVGVLLALKLKLILLGLAAAAVAILIKSSKPSYGYYPYIDYEYVSYPVPPGVYGSAPYRRPPVALAPKSMYLSELTARVWNSIDLTAMALGAMGVPDGSCRRRVVCQAERAADHSSVMKSALRLLGESLSKYKLRPGGNNRLSCEQLFADCPTHNLPQFLGGSDTRIHEIQPAPHHYSQSPWFGQSTAHVTHSISPQPSRLDPRRDVLKPVPHTNST